MRVFQAFHRDLHGVSVDVDPAGSPAGQEGSRNTAEQGQPFQLSICLYVYSQEGIH